MVQRYLGESGTEYSVMDKTCVPIHSFELELFVEPLGEIIRRPVSRRPCISDCIGKDDRCTSKCGLIVKIENYSILHDISNQRLDAMQLWVYCL